MAKHQYPTSTERCKSSPWINEEMYVINGVLRHYHTINGEHVIPMPGVWVKSTKTNMGVENIIRPIPVKALKDLGFVVQEPRAKRLRHGEAS